MIRTHEQRGGTRPAFWPAAVARALTVVTVLFALGPLSFVPRNAAAPQGPSAPHVAQLTSHTGKLNKTCPGKALPGQPTACSASTAPIAAFDDRGLALGPLSDRASRSPPYALTLATQYRGAPPDRPPRFAV